MSKHRRLIQLAASAIALATWKAAPAGGKPPQTVAGLEEKLSRTGVFFRADTPYALRDQEDAYLPLFLEIINGVEKAGRSGVAQAVRQITREPLRLEGLNVFVKPQGAQRQFPAEPLRLGPSKDFSFDFRTDGQPLIIADRWKKTLEIPLGSIEDYLKQHFLGDSFQTVDVQSVFNVAGWPTQTIYLRVRLHAPPMPEIPNWYRGDLHYHSAFTDNPAERGYPLDVTKQAALEAGFNWLVLADHSTDLDPERYSKELEEVKKYRDGRFLFIRGEEITVESEKPSALTTLHMVALPSAEDPDKGFPDPQGKFDAVFMTGDGSPGSPPIPLQEALARVAAGGGFAYAAHPFDPISPLLRGGMWDEAVDFLAAGGKQPRAGLVGLEPWNRATLATADDARDPFCLHRDAEPSACFQPDAQANQYERLDKAIQQGWLPLLRKGLASGPEAADAPLFKIFLAAGSDAHGDLNYEATMDAVDFLSKPSRGLSGYAEDNALGKVSTLVHCPGGMGTRGEKVLEALRDGHSILSNGPLVEAGFDTNGNGSLDDAEDVGPGQHVSFRPDSLPPLQIYWISSEEFGHFVSIRAIVGSSSGESAPIEVPIPKTKSLASDGFFPLDLRSHLETPGEGWSYVRLEAKTLNSAGEEFRCYTNPVWVRVTGR